jgi:O-antigen/teichoic acid export membrane protein
MNAVLSSIFNQETSAKRLLSWFKKGSVAVVEQACFAGSNFLVNILLARWLPSEQYGAFALAFSIFLFMSGFHNALLLEPMSVIGPANHRHHLKEYLGLLLWIHACLTSSLAVLLLMGAGTVALFTAQGPLAEALAGISIALPLILLLWLLRREFYLERNPRGALVGDMLYGFLLLNGLLLLKRLQIISPLSIFLLMGLASMIASGFLLYRLRPDFPTGYAAITPQLRVIGAENWRYGKWMVAIAVVSWLPANMYYVFTAGFLGFGGTGALRAIENLLLPVSHVMTALGLLLLPWASTRLKDKGLEVLKKDVIGITFLMIGLTGTYLLILLSSGRTVLQFLYGEKYHDVLWLLPYFAASPCIAAVSTGWQTGLRALQAPSTLFVAYCLKAAFTLSAGAAFVYLWGLFGVGIAGPTSALCQLLILMWYWKKITACRDDPASPRKPSHGMAVTL